MVKNWEFWGTMLGLGLALFVGGWGGRWAYDANNHSAPDSTIWFIRVGVVLIVVGALGVLACLIRDYRAGAQRHALQPESNPSLELRVSAPLTPQAPVNSSEAQPNLEIVIGAGPTFRQERRFVSSEGFPTKETLCRVGIRHDGHATVVNVSVDLESMKPPSLPAPLLLHQMNDNPPTGQFKQDFSLDGGETKYVDVVLEQHDDDEQPTRDRVLLLRRARGVPSRLSIFHIAPGVSQDIRAERHEIVIFAHGRDAKPVRQNFIIDVDDNGELQFASA